MTNPMHRGISTRAAIVVAAAFAAIPARAACTWEWLCNGEGACKQMPICDTVYEKPPPKPDSQPPAMPPISMKPYKMPSPMGTLTCEHIMRKEMNRWHWKEICYCTDAQRSPDPTPPFAHIVRCGEPWKE